MKARGLPFMTDVRKQAVTGVVPPQQAEAIIREVWPSVTATPTVASLARVLMRSRIGAPLGWLLLAPIYFKKLLAPAPGMARLAVRYTLTNRRLMIQHGLKPQPVLQVSLSDIDDVRIQKDSTDDFYGSANLEILHKGEVKLTLPGVKNPESFRHAILNSVKAWVPGKAAGPFVPAKAAAAT
jgi:hypothetical protein